MEILFILIFFAIGIVLIVKGGDFFVDAATWIAEVSGIPKFIVGATVVSVATTLPELIVSSMAAFDGKVDMAIGNAVGSVTANTGLIMGISIVCIPAIVKRKSFGVKGVMMILSCILLFALSLKGELTVIGSCILLFVFLLFIAENIRSAKAEQNSEGKISFEKKDIGINIFKFVIGAAGIVIGSRLLVDNGSAIARILKVPEGVIGLTIIAVGTSLPELVTTIIAISKKHGSLSLGNILGANIIDVTVILPVCSFISGGSLPVSAQTLFLDLPVCFGIMGIFMIPALIRERLDRWQGILMISTYIIYVLVLSFYIA